jgi:hypothetical protein
MAMIILLIGVIFFLFNARDIISCVLENVVCAKKEFNTLYYLPIYKDFISIIYK